MPYIQRLEDGTVVGIYANPQPDMPKEFAADGSDVILAYRALTAPKPLLSKVTILDRLNAAGLVAKAFTAMGGPGTYVYERWQAAPEMVDITHPLVVQVLDAIGADKSVILAP